MPFSSLSDPIDLARTQAALEKAWAEIRPAIGPGSSEEGERTRLACIIAALTSVAEDEDELARRAVARYRSQTLADFHPSSPAPDR